MKLLIKICDAAFPILVLIFMLVTSLLAYTTRDKIDANTEMIEMQATLMETQFENMALILDFLKKK